MMVRLGGVPEHFNFPWHLADSNGLYQKNKLEMQWRDYPGGTGDLLRDLQQNTLDLAILLSEGAVAGIDAGHPIHMITYTVETPLRWGVHVPPGSRHQQLSDLQENADPLRVAISRRYSGSHLMSYVLTDQLGLAQPEFVEVGSLDGAIRSFADAQADLFMWERFTTQPTVDRGQMRRIGECPTPWPPFCLVASNQFARQHRSAVDAMSRIWFESVELALGLPDLGQRISDFYQLKPQQVSQWLSCTRWATSPMLSDASLAAIIAELTKLELVDPGLKPADCRR